MKSEINGTNKWRDREKEREARSIRRKYCNGKCLINEQAEMRRYNKDREVFLSVFVVFQVGVIIGKRTRHVQRPAQQQQPRQHECASARICAGILE